MGIAYYHRRAVGRFPAQAQPAAISADPQSLWPPNHKMAAVAVTGGATDNGVGIQSVTFRIMDEYGRVQPAVAPVEGAGAASVNWTRVIELESARNDDDLDGRTYTIEATITDRACNVTTTTTTVIVPHDQRK
ncbi:MAG TPA: hypothetical protein VNO70_25535 [Blastocatellia bacterium]|nr:hypothetical protein [Blastocatellia bacterium]